MSEQKADPQVDKIMEELNELEKEIEASTAASTKPDLKLVPGAKEESMSEFHGGGSDYSMEETLGHLKDEEKGSENSLLDQTVVGSEQETSFDEAQANGEEQMSGGDSNDSLTLTLKGSMNLKLQYETDGQIVNVSFGNGCLKVQLADGAEFKIPMGRGSSAKAA